MKTVTIDLDDFSVLRNRMDLLLEFKEHYPGFKVSMFTIPFDYELETTLARLEREKSLKLIKENLDWIQIIPHGLSHIPNEFENADKTSMVLALKAIDEAFKKDGLPYEKGFKAPFWLWNKDVVDVLDKKGWWGAIDRNQPNMLKTKRYYTYTHSIDEPFWLSNLDTVHLHGHIGEPSSNSLGSCFLNLMKLPTNVEFKYVTEFIHENSGVS